MTYEDGKWWVEKRLKEMWVVVDDRKDPVERIDDISDDLENLIEFLPIPTHNNTTLLSQDIMQHFDNLPQTKFRYQLLNMIELIRNKAIFVSVYQLQTTNISFQL